MSNSEVFEVVDFSRALDANPRLAKLYNLLKCEDERFLFRALVSIGQAEHVFDGSETREQLENFFAPLKEVEAFYQPIGGLVGYYSQFLELKGQIVCNDCDKKYVPAPFFNMREGSQEVTGAVFSGIHALSFMGEIYPVGGLGDRLGLQNEKGSLPAALLPFCGRTLLEGLIRDLQAREYLYYKLLKVQVTVPTALMTSYEKEHARYIEAQLHEKNWFGRDPASYFLFSQVSAPVITAEGNWSLREKATLHLQPGGHGAIWRTAEQKGVFDWFKKQNKRAAWIRQINNPLAGLDTTLLALAGMGMMHQKTFGIAATARQSGAAEGVLFAAKMETHEALVNVEYVDLTKKRAAFAEIEEKALANTNILYIDLEKVRRYVKKNPLPGVILNMKSQVVTWVKGEYKRILGGRLESMMQNISDSIPLQEAFLTFQEREKTISVAKKCYEKGKSAFETPLQAFYDLQKLGVALLKSCGFNIADISAHEEFLESGPSHIFLYHPALGPLFSVIKQKLKGGVFALRSELQLEIAEIEIEDLQLDGSLKIEAENVMGDKVPRLRYSEQTGKCRLHNVRVKNLGINRVAANEYWKNEISHIEKMSIYIYGNGEFVAENVIFEGNYDIVVPAGIRVRAFQCTNGRVEFIQERIEAPQWCWEYQFSNFNVLLKKRERLF